VLAVSGLLGTPGLLAADLATLECKCAREHASASAAPLVSSKMESQIWRCKSATQTAATTRCQNGHHGATGAIAERAATAGTECEKGFACETMERRTVRDRTWTPINATLSHAPETLRNQLATGQHGLNAVYLAASDKKRVHEHALTTQDAADGTSSKISNSASAENPAASGQAGSVGARALLLAISALEHERESA